MWDPNVGCDENRKRRYQISIGEMPGGTPYAGFDDERMARKAFAMYTGSPRANVYTFVLYDEGREIDRKTTPGRGAVLAKGGGPKK